MATTFVILAITIVLFIWGKPRADITALLSMLALYLSGIITSGQMLSGFADAAVIMIATLFVVSEGLTQTGITGWLGAKMMNLSHRQPRLLLLWMMGISLVVSSFMSNTATVAALMPAVVAAAWGVGSTPSKYLIPLSFITITGGLLTLMATPPNIIASEALVNAGYAPIGFFDFAWVGLPLAIIVMIYMATIGQKLLPEASSGSKPLDLHTTMNELADTYSLHGKLFRLYLKANSPLVGKKLDETGLGQEREITVLQIEQHPLEFPPAPTDALGRWFGPKNIIIPTGGTYFQAGDELWVRATPEIIEQAQQDFDLDVIPMDADQEPISKTLLSREMGMAEVLITPRSDLIGKSLAESRFANRFGVQVIGIRRHDQIAKRQRIKLSFGDSLLVRGSWDALQNLIDDRYNFVVVGSPQAMAEQVPTLGRQAWVVLAAVAIMILLMFTALVPNVVAALIAAGIIVLGGALSPEKIYQAINWPSIVLIAAMIPMSTALEVSGGAAFLVAWMVDTLGSSPHLLLLGIFLITSILTQVISNTATAVLAAPLALQAALAAGISPYPMLMMVAVGAATPFLTPISTPTNLLVMAPGGYQFRHYALVGAPVYLAFLVVALLLIPLIWPI